MLYARQRLLLNLLDNLQDNCAGTDFQKYLFLFTQEFEAKPSYDFVPYRFGCFSFTAYADKRKLIEFGLLEKNDERWILTNEGERAVQERPFAPILLAEFRERYGKLKGNQLIREIYTRYPYYAISSEIADVVLTGGEEHESVASARPFTKNPGLLTIGYEGKSLEAYLNELIGAGVTLLCDVRRNPLSRKYGFSKSTLQPTCEKLGIRYEHLPELGIASDRRKTLDQQADYDALFADYVNNDLPLQTSTLERIAHWVTQDKQRVALTCFELKHHQCHRHSVANALYTVNRTALRPVHL